MNIKVPGRVIWSQFNAASINSTITSQRPQRRRALCSYLHLLAGLRCQATWLALLLTVPLLSAQDFTVTSPGSFYSINGQSQNPTLTLVRGKTYTFSVATASNHPFQILSPGNAVGNNTSSGTITYTVATNAPATINPGYRCSLHNFSGIILTVDPPPPPVINILSLSVSSNLVLRSSGTNGWKVIPEFKTNPVQADWSALAIQTNTLANGTNETICGKPDGDVVIIRIRSQPN